MNQGRKEGRNITGTRFGDRNGRKLVKAWRQIKYLKNT